MEQQILGWIAHYGYAAIFCLMMFGIVGLPAPDETLLTFSGYLVVEGDLLAAPGAGHGVRGERLRHHPQLLAGRTFGLALIHRYGRYVRVTEEHVNKAHAWFERVGHWGLTFGYFIPGVRHLTAYAAGMSGLNCVRSRCLPTPGRACGSARFIGLGYFLGDRWQAVEGNIHHWLGVAALAGLVALVGWLVWRKLRRK